MRQAACCKTSNTAAAYPRFSGILVAPSSEPILQCSRFCLHVPPSASRIPTRVKNSGQSFGINTPPSGFFSCMRNSTSASVSKASKLVGQR
jgi:hypothetical protein